MVLLGEDNGLGNKSFWRRRQDKAEIGVGAANAEKASATGGTTASSGWRDDDDDDKRVHQPK